MQYSTLNENEEKLLNFSDDIKSVSNLEIIPEV